MVRAADAPTLMRASVVAELMTSVGIVVLAVLLYVVLSVENRTLALVALGLWLAEAIVLAVDEPARGRCRSLRRIGRPAGHRSSVAALLGQRTVG
jgi:hypothetical protein